jgi:hypothetical protein
MKLQIEDNTLRLRVSSSDLARLLARGRIEATIHFTGFEGEKWTYAIEARPDLQIPTLEYRPAEIIVILPATQAETWNDSDEAGIYASCDLGRGERLELSIEKDIAGRDLSDRDDEDYSGPAIETAF